MYTRELLAQQREAAARMERRDSLLLAIVSVVVGLVLLALVRWEHAHIGGALGASISGTAFLLYLGLLGMLLWRSKRRLRAIRPKCPQCGVSLKGFSERIAVATGRCDSCGAWVIEREGDVAQGCGRSMEE